MKNSCKYFEMIFDDDFVFFWTAFLVRSVSYVTSRVCIDYQRLSPINVWKVRLE